MLGCDESQSFLVINHSTTVDWRRVWIRLALCALEVEDDKACKNGLDLGYGVLWSIEYPTPWGTKDTPWGPFPYEASYWGALEDPLQYLISFFALSLAGYLIAPLFVSNYVLPAWKGVTMASFVWFLRRWKRSAFAQAFTVTEINEVDRINLTNLDTLLSNGIFGLGLLALAAAVEVSMQYIIWISLAGEWVVVLAGRDTMRNVLYGYCLEVGVGDMVKVF
ncbi:hypothetical protein C3L33_19560, partial [Rhododendron williamsianum]